MPVPVTFRILSRLFVPIFGLIASYFLIWPLWRAFFPMEITPNEGWNAYHQDAAIHGVLYPPTDALIVNNYPPLSFYGIGSLGVWLGDSLYVGRALSVVGVLGLGVVIALAVRRLGGGISAAAIAGFWFIAVMAGSFNRFVGMNDPQLFAQLIMGIALIWFMAREARNESVELPILLMVFAGFIKHNIVVIPVTTLLWMALRDWRSALRPILVGVLGAGSGLLICVLVFGDAFLHNLLAARQYRFMRILELTGRFQWVLPAMIVWAIWAWHARKTAAARFMALYICLGLLFCLLQWAGEDVVDNAQFDLVIAVAIGLGVAFERIGDISRTRSVVHMRTVVILVLAVRLLATGRVELALILFSPDYRAAFPQHAAIVDSETERVKGIKGDVWCMNKVVCRRAGKPFAGDDFKIGQMLVTGALTQVQLKELLKTRGVTVVSNDADADANSLRRDLIDNLRSRFGRP
jgi:hypothetical protein